MRDDRPCVYAWDTWPVDGTRETGATFGACGVNDQRQLAFTALESELGEQPGYRGHLVEARVDVGGSAPYDYKRVLTQGHHDPNTGQLVWTKPEVAVPDPSFWAHALPRSVGSEP